MSYEDRCAKSDEDYLAQSHDLVDLERRQRQLSYASRQRELTNSARRWV